MNDGKWVVIRFMQERYIYGEWETDYWFLEKDKVFFDVQKTGKIKELKIVKAYPEISSTRKIVEAKNGMYEFHDSDGNIFRGKAVDEKYEIPAQETDTFKIFIEENETDFGFVEYPSDPNTLYMYRFQEIDVVFVYLTIEEIFEFLEAHEVQISHGEDSDWFVDEFGEPVYILDCNFSKN